MKTILEKAFNSGADSTMDFNEFYSFNDNRGWVDVNDNLPLYDHDVIIAVKGEKEPSVGWLSRVITSVKGEDISFSRDESSGVKDLFNKVTHWMPLPDMPIK